MSHPRTIKAKVCLVGEIAVGKTSLVRRYSAGTFDEVYATTLGIHISKKTLAPRDPPPGGPAKVELILYDVMGQRNLRDLLVESYFKGAQALLAVWDVTRPGTLGELPKWIDMAREVAGPIPVVIATNKMDLSDDREVESDALEDLTRESGGECFSTSAKTGENVDAVFERLAGDLVKKREPGRQARAGSSGAPNLESVARKIVRESPKRPA